MKFCWTTIYVKDMEESLKFYQDFLGLSLNSRTSPAEGMELAFLGKGDTQVELIKREGMPDPAFGKSISMGFQVTSLDETMEELTRRGIPVLEGPFQPGPGIRFLYIHDPNGMKIQLVEFLKN